MVPDTMQARFHCRGKETESLQSEALGTLLYTPSRSQEVRTIVPSESGKAFQGQGTEGASAFPLFSKPLGAGAVARGS